MKRIISCILCMILVLSLLPAGSFAAVTTRVYCKAPDTWEQCFVYYWGASGYSEVLWPGVSMERDEKGIWYYDVPYEATKLIFNNGLGTQTVDLDLPADLRNMYDFQERCWTEYGWKPYVPVYYVAGVEELCGIAWDPGASENKMTDIDGIYTKTYTDVAAGVYEFKVTNGTWDWSWGASNGFDNYIFTVEQDNSTVVITFDPAKPLVNVDVMGPGIPPEDYLISEGIMNFISKEASIFGISINFTATSDGMVTIDMLEMDDDALITVFVDNEYYTSFTVNNAPESVEFSVQANVRYEVEFDNVRYEDETFEVCQPMIGAMTYRMTSDVPVNDVIRWPYEDPGMILQEVYNREDSMLLAQGVTLVGEITKVVTPYDPVYDNITVEMVVPGYESMPVQCYRMSGDGVEDLVIGDSIVVSGFLTAHRGTVQFDWGCSLDIVLNDYLDVPHPSDDPPALVDIAYALKSRERYPYVSTLTGKIVSIDVPYSDTYQNITVTIAVEGRENKPIVCYRLKGDGVETLEVGDVITVEGILQKCIQRDVNSYSMFESVEFDASSRLVEVSQKPHQTTRVYCNPPWERCYVYYWYRNGQTDCSWPGIKMLQDADGIWFYDVPSDVSGLLFNNGQGSQTADLKLPADSKNMYDFQSLCWTEHTLDPFVPAYYVAGVEELCGIAWHPSASENMMTKVDGLYTKTYTNVAAGTYEFKVTAGSWDCFWGMPNSMNNYVLTVEQDNSTVVITFNPATELVNAEVIGPETPKDFGAILQEAYGLEEGMSLPYCATLVGDIIDVVTPYDSYYNNITVEMVVPGYESMPVQCYRLCGDGVNNLAVGDTITVSGFLWNYRGIIEFDQGCSLDAVIKGDIDVPAPIEDPLELVDAAYALAPGESLPYMSTLTGQIVSIDSPYSDQYRNITVTIVVPGRENKPICCYRLKGDGAEYLAVGDEITVKGVLKHYAKYNEYGYLLSSQIEFDAGCKLLNTPEDPQKTTMVYCYTPWEQCYVYTWDWTYYQAHSGEWPGTLMTDEGNGLWSYELPAEAESLIFNSGRGYQTNDLTVPTDENILYIVESCEWTDLSWSGPDDNIRSLTVVAPESWGQLYIYTWGPETYGEFPGKPLEKDGDVYRDVISSELTYMVISAAEPGGGYYDTGVIDLRTGTDGVTVIIDGNRSYSLYYDDYQENTYRVVGNADFMGNWDCASDAGRMHQIDDGVYQVEFENVPPGYYEFRITLNGVWDDSLGYDEYSNFTFDLSEISNVCVTFYEYSRVVDISYDGNNDNFGLDSLALVGTGLPGINEWDPADPAGDMTEITDLVYQKTLTFKAGTAIEFKIVGNDEWDDQWNMGGAGLVLDQILYLNSLSYDSTLQLYIERDCQLTFTVDLRPLLDGGYATLLVEEVDSPTPAQRKLTINMPGTWQYVNIFTWSPETYGAWPGAQVPYNGQSYQTMIDANMENLIINGLDSYGNFRQTNDIYLECNGKDVTITVREDLTCYVNYQKMPEQARFLTVVAPASWNNPYIYTWDPASCGDFPGMALSYGGTYYWTLISSQETNMVISGYRDDGTLRMTDDIHLSVGIRPVTIVIHEDGTHTVIYDDEPKPEDDTLRVVGNADFMGNWDAASNEGLMEQIDLGVKQKIFKNVQPGTYEFKITRNGKWDNAIGDAQGNNLTFTVTKPSNVCITCSFDAGDFFVEILVSPKDMGDVTGDGKLNMGDVAKIYAHIRGTNLLSDVALKVADFNGDGKINIGDTARIYAYLRGTDPTSIVDAAYNLAMNEELSTTSKLTGTVLEIVEPYNAQRGDITLIMVVDGREDYPLLCSRLQVADAADVGVNDQITVSGKLRNYYGTVEFKEGCQLVNWDDVRTPEEEMAKIVDEAYALDHNQAMNGTVTLTGRVISVEQAYNGVYPYICVTMTVTGRLEKPISCYRLMGEQISLVGVGDTITVTGTLRNFYGTVEFAEGCNLDKRVSGGGTPVIQETDPLKIIDIAYALAKDTEMTYDVTLKGKVISIKEAYSADYKNISVMIQVTGRESKPILVYRLKGDNVDKIAVGDTITVVGRLKNYNNTIEMVNCTMTARTSGGGTVVTQETDPAKIMAAAKALAENAEMSYDVTLSGKVISIDQPYDSEFKNVTATISVTGTSDNLRLYRLKGDGVEKLAVNDTITVVGRIKNYYGTIELINCTMTARTSGGGTVPVAPSDPKQIVDEAYNLAPGTSLPYKVTLTGKIISIDTPYDANYKNLTVTIAVAGKEDKPIRCYRLKGTGAESLAVGNTITVSGIIKNYQYSFGECKIEFDAGCTLDNVTQ